MKEYPLGMPKWVHPDDLKNHPFCRPETEEERKERELFRQSDEYKKMIESLESFKKCIITDDKGNCYIKTI